MKPAKKIHKTLKNSKFGNEVSPILSAVNQMVDFIKPTLGPRVRHILVDSGYKTEMSDDGVSIAREFELEDPFENAVVDYVRQAAEKSDDKAGDGTTTTMILLQSLLSEITGSGKNYPEVKAELDKAVEEVREELKKQALPINSEEDLLKVARTSMNDEELAKLVAKVVFLTGAKGALTITDWTGRGTEFEKLEGFILPRGYIARGMVTDKEKQTFEAPNSNFTGRVAIAVVPELISKQEEILPILESAERLKIKNLLIVCNNLIGEALGAVAQAQMRGLFNICAVPLPGQGDKVHDFVQDLCVVTGATSSTDAFSETSFGYSDRVLVSKEDAMIIGGQGNKEDIEKHTKYLQAKSEEMKDDYDRSYLHNRQARIQGGVVVIKVGGYTDTEISLKTKKIEDAVNACKCALEEGVVPGAGAILFLMNTSSNALNNALKSVFRQVLANSELPEPEIKAGESVNVLTNEVGEFLKVGVVDSAKVLRTAVENAASIAVSLFSTSGIITSKPDDSEKV